MVQRTLQQELRLTGREPRGERTKLRRLEGQQLLDITRQPDLSAEETEALLRGLFDMQAERHGAHRCSARSQAAPGAPAPR